METVTDWHLLKKINSVAPNPDLSNGYYVHDNQIFTNRELIFDHIINNNKRGPIEFYFHDHVFSKIDWTIEPNISLPELYRMRAQQLRDSYDYLILSFSGGSDSNEILHTFLENNIFLDEIQVVEYERAISKLDDNLLRNDIELCSFLEYRINVLPKLKLLKEKSPQTKITILDGTDFFEKDVVGAKFQMFGHTGFAPTIRTCVTMVSRTVYDTLHHYNMKQSNGKNKIAWISGLEKPSTAISDDGIMWFSFNDCVYGNTKYKNNKVIDNVYNIEEFFWSPFAPLIPVKQSHLIKNALETNQTFLKEYIYNQYNVLNQNKSSETTHSSFYDFQKKLIPIIYQYFNGLNFPKPRKISPEFKLETVLTKTNNGFSAAKELNDFVFKKYKNQLILKRDIIRLLHTRKYVIGKLNIKKN